MAATNAQVQQFVTERMRARAQQLRALKASLEDDKAVIDDIYQNLANNPTWVDVNTANPPHLLTPNDVLAYNSFIVAMLEFFNANGDPTLMATGGDQWPIIQKACAIPVMMQS